MAKRSTKTRKPVKAAKADRVYVAIDISKPERNYVELRGRSMVDALQRYTLNNGGLYQLLFRDWNFRGVKFPKQVEFTECAFEGADFTGARLADGFNIRASCNLTHATGILTAGPFGNSRRMMYSTRVKGVTMIYSGCLGVTLEGWIEWCKDNRKGFPEYIATAQSLDRIWQVREVQMNRGKR